MAANVAVTYNFVAGNPAVADNVDQNFADIVTWINTNAVHLDGSKAFTGAPSYGSDPTSANQLARKAYVDTKMSAVTSTTRPAAPVSGQMILETDKKRVRVWDGSAWLLVSGAMHAGASNTGTSVANTVTATLTFATEDADTDAFFTAGGSTFTIPEDGTYAITARLSKTAGNSFNAGFSSFMEFVTPGSANFRYIPSGFDTMTGTVVRRFAASDTFTVTFTNNTGGSTTFNSVVTVQRVGD